MSRRVICNLFLYIVIKKIYDRHNSVLVSAHRNQQSKNIRDGSGPVKTTHGIFITSSLDISQRKTNTSGSNQNQYLFME